MDITTKTTTMASTTTFFIAVSLVVLTSFLATGAEVTITSSSLSSSSSSSYVSSSDNEVVCGKAEWGRHPVLCDTISLAKDNLDGFAATVHDWAASNGLLVDLRNKMSSSSSSGGGGGVNSARAVQRRLRLGTSGSVTAVAAAATSSTANANANDQQQQQLPVVLAHGMGDSCFNGGMQHVTKYVSEKLSGAYTVCIPTGSTQAEDTSNGYFLNMNDNVKIFADRIVSDPALAGGFHAIGFSQGSNIVRGYIAKYNVPAVHTFLSVNGVNAGVGAVPYCRPDKDDDNNDNGDDDDYDDDAARTTSKEKNKKDAVLGMFSMCDLLMEQASRSAYTDFAQEHSFQANYWRDPRPSAAALYHKFGQLAVWNNEATDYYPFNETLRNNWNKTSKFVWVLATEDGMVWPREGEHWGAPDPADPFQRVLPMKETAWYRQDLFGLKTAEEAGKNVFESFVGDHLQFSSDDFDKWIHTYLRAAGKQQ